MKTTESLHTIHGWLRTVIFCTVLLSAVSISVNSQISRGGSPLKSGTAIEWISLPAVRVDEMLIEDEALALSGRKNKRIAEEIQVFIDPGYQGRWEQLPDGTRIWKAGIRSPGARALGLVFSRYELEEGVRVFIYDPAGENILGAYSRTNNKSSGELAVSYLRGDELIVQMEMDPGVPAYGSLSIGRVRWAYLPVFPDISFKDGYFGNSGACNVDINCSQGDDWQELKHSVVRMIGAENCTGVLINNTSNDSLAYVYTAAHCIFDKNKLQPIIFYFNYESPGCDGPDGSTSQSISGYKLIATGDTLEDPTDKDSLDFALLELSVYPPPEYDAYFAGWYRGATPARHTTTLHHPSGDVLKISVDNNPPQVSYPNNINYWPELVKYSHWRILEWDVGTTEGGSSGCPLFNQDQLVVGTLTGGDAFCTKSINDFFTRMDYAWDYYPEPRKQLKQWLDPGNTGAESIPGRSNINAVKELENPAPAPMIFPNPATDRITLKANLRPGEDARISLYNAEGKLLREYTESWKGSLEMQVEGLPAGLYICRILQADRVLAGRFIISR